jgi:hypothetical protein
MGRTQGQVVIHWTLDRIAGAYMRARHAVADQGYAHEWVIQRDARIECISRELLLRECAWVILSSGMAERSISRVFGAIEDAFENWDCDAITRSPEQCVASALPWFNHPGKIGAIAEAAFRCNDPHTLDEVRAGRVDGLMEIPFIGPVTIMHLAKNLGVQVAKPDRHLQRIASSVGYDSVQALCKDIAWYVGDPPNVVDVVMWRYMASVKPSSESFVQVLEGSPWHIELELLDETPEPSGPSASLSPHQLCLKCAPAG